MKQWLKDYLFMSKKERMGMLVLMVLVASIWLLPRWFGSKPPNPTLTARADSLIAVSKSPLPERPKYFDPNTAGDNELRSLGFSERNLRTLRNYLDKGGRFRNPGDLGKIYGVSPELAGRLEPFVRIKGLQAMRRSPTSYAYERPAVYRRNAYDRPYYVKMVDDAITYKRVRSYTVLDLNEADTAALINLPGIGSKLAARIVLFRERCGGFHSVEQLAEVYGIRDSLFQMLRPRLKVTDPQLRQLKINRIEADSLAMHPYIKRSEARAIVQYRQQHGDFHHADDLLNIAIITKELLVKLAPYLDFN